MKWELVGTGPDGTEERIELPETTSGVLVAGMAYDATLGLVRHFAVKVTDRSTLSGNLIPAAMGKVLARLKDDGGAIVGQRAVEVALKQMGENRGDGPASE